VSTIDKSKTVFNDLLSVPKIIGMGPKTTTPPPLTLPFPEERIDSENSAERIRSAPTTIIAKPNEYKSPFLPTSQFSNDANLRSGFDFNKHD